MVLASADAIVSDMRRSVGGLLIIALAVAAVSCSEPTQEVTGKTWQLVTLDGAPLVEGTTVDMTLENDMVSGSSGCNQYNGPATYSDGSMTLGPDFAVTFALCDEPTNEQEQKYIQTLGRVVSYEVTADELLLQDAQGITIATYE